MAEGGAVPGVEDDARGFCEAVWLEADGRRFGGSWVGLGSCGPALGGSEARRGTGFRDGRVHLDLRILKRLSWCYVCDEWDDGRCSLGFHVARLRFALRSRKVD